MEIESTRNDVNHLYRKKDNQIPRFAVSDIAAIAGYNRWTSPKDLFQKYLYQDLLPLLLLDAENVGVKIVDEEEEFNITLEKLSVEDKQVIKYIQENAESAAADITTTRELTKNVDKILTEKKIVSLLDKNELQIIRNHIVDKMFRSYGCIKESYVLDEYEKLCDCKVSERNDKLLIWPVIENQSVHTPIELIETYNRFRPHDNRKSNSYTGYSNTDTKCFQSSVCVGRNECPDITTNQHTLDTKPQLVALLRLVCDSLGLDPEKCLNSNPIVDNLSSYFCPLQRSSSLPAIYREGWPSPLRCPQRRRPLWIAHSWLHDVVPYESRPLCPPTAFHEPDNTLSSPQRLSEPRDKEVVDALVALVEAIVDKSCNKSRAAPLVIVDGIGIVETRNIYALATHTVLNERSLQPDGAAAVQSSISPATTSEIHASDRCGPRKRRRLSKQGERVVLVPVPSTSSDASDPITNDSRMQKSSCIRVCQFSSDMTSCMRSVLQSLCTVDTRIHWSMAGDSVMLWTQVERVVECPLHWSNLRPDSACEIFYWEDDHTNTVPDTPSDGSDHESGAGGSKTLASSPDIRNQRSSDGTASASNVPDAATLALDPMFYIVGKVDGVSHQLDLSSPDPRQWVPVKVVVEVKNRIGAIAASPPLYDIIQLSTYMLMLGCECGDLVEAYAPEDISERGPGWTILETHSVQGGTVPPAASSCAPDQQTAALSVHITRVRLHDCVLDHGEHWYSSVFPALKSFARAIEEVRRDDMMRYRWLLSDDSEKLRMIAELCPHMSNIVS